MNTTPTPVRTIETPAPALALYSRAATQAHQISRADLLDKRRPQTRWTVAQRVQTEQGQALSLHTGGSVRASLRPATPHTPAGDPVALDESATPALARACKGIRPTDRSVREVRIGEGRLILGPIELPAELDADETPIGTPLDEGRPFAELHTTKADLRHLVQHAAREEGRYAMHTVALVRDPAADPTNPPTTVATDGRRLLVARDAWHNVTGWTPEVAGPRWSAGTVQLDRAPLAAAARIAAPSDAIRVRIGTDKSGARPVAVITIERAGYLIEFAWTLDEGEFPRYAAVVPDRSGQWVTGTARAILEAIEQVRPAMPDDLPAVSIVVPEAGRSWALATRSKNGDARAYVTAGHAHSSLADAVDDVQRRAVMIDADYLTDAVRAVASHYGPDDWLRLQIDGRTSPVRVDRIDEGQAPPRRMVIVMPLTSDV
jgi:hypothetical protein